jgi:uncharacterized membrane protein (UPF0136 family)
MQIFYFLLGALTIAGGVQGFLAGSKASLIAAGILGGLIVAGGVLLGSQPTLAMILALVGSLGIAGKFVPDFLKKGRALWPAGTLALLSVIGIVWTIVGLVQK